MIEVTSGRRPGKPDIAQSLHQSSFDDLWDLIVQCWGSKLEDRLLMSTVLAGLEKLLLASSSPSVSKAEDIPAAAPDVASGDLAGEFTVRIVNLRIDSTMFC